MKPSAPRTAFATTWATTIACYLIYVVFYQPTEADQHSRVGMLDVLLVFFMGIVGGFVTGLLAAFATVHHDRIRRGPSHRRCVQPSSAIAAVLVSAADLQFAVPAMLGTIGFLAVYLGLLYLCQRQLTDSA